MHKIICGAVVAVLVCAGAQSYSKNRQVPESMPDWVNSPSSEFPQSRYMTSVGDAADRTSAGVKAVNALTAIFRQKVTSATTASKRMERAESSGKVGYTDNAQLDQNVKQQVNEEDIIGVKISLWWYDGKSTWYALATLDKPEASDIYSKMMEQNSAEIHALINNIPKEDAYSFDAYERYDFACEIAAVNDRYMERLQVIDPVKADSMRGSLVSLKQLKKDMIDLAQHIPVRMEITGDDTGRVSGAFADVLADNGFRTGNAGNERYALSGSVTLTRSQNQEGTLVYCNYVIGVYLTDTKNTMQLFPFEAHGRDGAKTYKDASARIQIGMEKKIRSDFAAQLSAYLNSIPVE